MANRKVVVSPGDIYYNYKIIEEVCKIKKQRRFIVECLCDKKTRKEVSLNNLRRGANQSCGCLKMAVVNVGDVFGKWTVVQEIENVENKIGWKRRALVRCSCEDKTERIVNLKNLRSGLSNSCGCTNKERLRELSKILADRSRGKIKPVIEVKPGDVYGKLTIIKEVERVNNRRFVLVECSCPDKTRKEVNFLALRDGGFQSCGCASKEYFENKIEDVIGKVYGRLTVIEELDRIDKKLRRVLVECSCPDKTRKEVNLNCLRTGKTKSCGCIKDEMYKEKNENVIGKVYGRLTVVAEVKRKRGKKNRKGPRKVLAKCNCTENNKPKIYKLSHLRSGKTNSCGCYAIEKTREARILQVKDYQEKYPFFCKIEEIMDDPDDYGILVRCKKCDKWYKPTNSQIQRRVQAIERPRGFEEQNFYCSDDCKHSCPLYRLQSDPFKQTEQNLYKPTPYELAI